MNPWPMEWYGLPHSQLLRKKDGEERNNLTNNETVVREKERAKPAPELDEQAAGQARDVYLCVEKINGTTK